MTRPSATQIDDAIVDAAAGLFATQGVGGTSVAQIASAVGYSKTGLLHRFPSKQALVDAVLVDTRTRLDAIDLSLRHLPRGTARDVTAVRAVADLALERPGQVALVLAAFTAGPSTGVVIADEPLLLDVKASIRGVFGGAGDVELTDADAVARAVRVATALAGIAVTISLVTEFARQSGLTAARTLLTTVALDALGVPHDAR